MNASGRERLDLGEGAWLDWWPRFLQPDDLPDTAALCAELPLRAERFRIFGREVAAPRLVSWHGNPGCRYRYSGQSFEPQPWTPSLARFRQELCDATGLEWNGVLANLYRDGRDSMGWHADDERELGPHPEDVAVASLSFGGERRFVLRHRRSRERHSFALGAGTLLVMRGATQRHWQHALPKTRKAVAPRLNLTFRVLTPDPYAGL